MGERRRGFVVISGRTSALLVIILALGLSFCGCDELNEETYVAVMVERLRLEAEGLPAGRAFEAAARLHGTTPEKVYGYSRWLFRDRDTDVRVAEEIARRARPYLRPPRKRLTQ